MNFLKRFVLRLAGGRKAVDLFALIDSTHSAEGGMGSSFRARVIDGYKRNGVAYRAIGGLASDLSAIPWLLFRKRRNAEADEEIKDHPILDLIQRPNPYQAKARFMEELVINMFLAGKDYVRIRSTGDTNGTILLNLRPDNVRLRNPQDPAAGWQFIDSSQPLPREEVLFLNFLDPLDAFDGLSPLEVATLPIDQANASRRWNWNMLRRGARPPGILKSKMTVTPEFREKIRNEFMVSLGGFENTGIPPVTGGDLDWQPTGLSPGEMEWTQGTILADRLTATTLGYPSQLLGDREASTYANYQEARKALYQERIVPLLVWIIGEFNNWLVPLMDDTGDMYLAPDLDSVDALHEARKDEWDRVTRCDVLSLDEKRQALRYEAIGGEGGNLICLTNGIVVNAETGQVYMPATLMPSTGEEEPIAAEPAQPPAPAGEEEEGVEPEEEERARKWFNLATPDSKRVHWISVERNRIGYERMAKALARRIFDSERRRVVNEARNAPNGDWLIHVATQTIRTNDADWKAYYKRVYQTVGSKFAAAVARAIGKSQSLGFEEKGVVDQWMVYIGQWVDQNAGEKIAGIGETTIGQVQAIVNQGIAEGMGVIDIAGEIDKLYLDQIIPRRSEVIARTEVVSASNHASDFSARATGLPLQKEWIATFDDRTRDSHREVNGQRVGMDDPFKVNGSLMLFPGDSSLGAPAGEIIQCRCTVGYHVVHE